ncbi:mitochondrial tRNA methylthiotransferase CDK5RAP1-like isoform X2 [Watersipora subatra]|uniref:mitochondrial tRNA methylthiotransferase CDK5RAP1-like isoform X2 n=1 Tax=Watersipora subatra TaxID=2589382 RepID=UPI00355BE9D9
MVNHEKADVIFLMTCSIREGAEKRIWGRVDTLQGLKRTRVNGQPQVKIGILGCMAERLKSQILEERKSVDLVCGPDAYKDLPRLLSITHSGQTAVNVMLSLDETYADVMPVRLNPESPSAFVSIMRGCENMCSYCIVPFTRGRERSRPIASILDEVRMLRDQGIKEVTLLGQNVNSYRDLSESKYASEEKLPTKMAKGFKTVYKTKLGGTRFADLLDHVSRVDPEMRIRFTSPHPKDFPDEVLDLINERSNICNQLHMPAQSGSTAVLESMRRGYTREAYLQLVHHVKKRIPDVKLSSDFISGFCGETEEDHHATLTLLDLVRYHRVFHFPYSLREKTHAHRALKDDVPQEVKLRRHEEVRAKCRGIFSELNAADVGQTQLVLIESESKRSSDDWAARNDGNTKVIFPKGSVPTSYAGANLKTPSIGDYVAVRITSSTSATLRGKPMFTSGIKDFALYEESLRDDKQFQGYSL